jgi:carboxylate-amine ligase
VELMMEAGAIDDYSYLWWDVRPHPNLGTVETRVFDQQTRLEDTAALAAMTHCLAHGLAGLFDAGEVLVEVPTELVDDNKVRAALRGLEGELIDFPHRKSVPAPDMIRHLIETLHDDAEELGCVAELESVEGMITRGTGARRQLELADGGADTRAIVAEIVEKSRA